MGSEDQEILIGESYIPINLVSQEAYKEKFGRAASFQLHYWWTRKPLITTRTAILAGSLSSSFPMSFLTNNLLDLGDGSSSRSYQADLSKYADMLSFEYQKVFETTRPLLFDPFAGGGSIPFEALRLGFDVIANDYNPVSWLILKTTLEYPKNYGKKLLADVEKAFKQLFDQLETTLSDNYVEYSKSNGWIPVTYFYAWSVSCEECLFNAPLVNNWRLKNRNDELIYLEPSVKEDKLNVKIIEVKSDEVDLAEEKKKIKKGTIYRGKGTCLSCGASIRNAHIVEEINQNESEILLAVVEVNPNQTGKRYRLPTDKELINHRRRMELSDNWKNLAGLNEFMPDIEMPYGIVFSAKYLDKWKRLFNPRQRLFFATFIRHARSLVHEISKDTTYQTVMVSYLAILLGKLLDFNSRSTGWIDMRETLRDSVAFRGFGMVWDHCEVNPFAPSGSGTWKSMTNNILAGLKFAIQHLGETRGKITITRQDAREIQLDKQADIICTDPPFGDDVPYAEISEFFFAWQKILLSGFHKEISNLKMVPKSKDISSNRKNRNNEYVKISLEKAFANLKDQLSPAGVLSLFFAHSSVDVWEFITSALQNAGFTIKSTYPLQTENPSNPLTIDKSSLFQSLLFICRNNNLSRKKKSFDILESKIKEETLEKVELLWQHGLNGSDLVMAAIGPILKIITSFGQFSSERINSSTILSLASEYVIDHIQTNIIDNFSELDKQTRLYFYLRLNGKIKITKNELMKLVADHDTTIENFTRNNLMVRVDGKSETKFKLSTYSERKSLSSPNRIVDIIHLLFQKYKSSNLSLVKKYIISQKLDTSILNESLMIMAHGGMKDDGSVLQIVDEDVKVANEILSEPLLFSTNLKHKT